MTQHNQFVFEELLGQIVIPVLPKTAKHLPNYRYRLASGPFYLFAIATQARKLCRKLSNKCEIFAYFEK
jgi:hypothetical protein